MKVINLADNKEYILKLSKYIQRGSLVPIIGSGFTKGCKANNHTVPDAKGMLKIMITEICKANHELSESDFGSRELRFSQIADYFYRFVDKSRQHQIIKNYFVNVKIDNEKRLFLRIKWPYLYTLNIDDGIEKNSQFDKVIPYKKLTEDIKLMSCVFKLHGDAFHEITYPEEQNIIFSREHYIKSLEKNKTMLNLFQSDYSDKNIIFIGCSLEDELDLDYIITTNENLSTSIVSRIFVTTTEPDPIRKLELEKFCITDILIIDDYNEFYKTLYSIFEQLPDTNENILQRYLNPNVVKINKGGYENKVYLQGFNAYFSSNGYLLPDFSVLRNVTSEILSKIESNTLNLLVGRRVSGKTISMLQIASSIKNKNVYFFPSNISLSSREINNVLDKQNAIIIFDSNSISYQDAHIILKRIDILKNNNTNILFAINSSDRLMFALLSSPDQIGYYEIADKLSDNDTNKINVELSKLGLTKFQYNCTILENFYRYSHIYNHDILSLPKVEIDKISDNHIKIIIILATLDKIYSILFNLLEISYKEADECLIKFEPVIQKEYPHFIELHQHSGFKAVANCKSWIYHTLGEYAKSDKSILRLSTIIHSIVESTIDSPKHSAVYKNLILFDTLNQIFYRKERGVIKLIFTIYEDLEDLLYEEGHYWLQRAKSILYLKRKDSDYLQKALDFAKKSYYDASEDVKLKNNSMLTVAQIFGRLANLNNYKSVYLLEESISWYFNTLQANRFNKKYIENVISKAKHYKLKNDLYSLVLFIVKNSPSNAKIKRKAEWLVNQIIIK